MTFARCAPGVHSKAVLALSVRRHLVEARHLVALAGPLVFAQLTQMSMGFVDTLMAGRLGPEALAAMALGGVPYGFVTVVGIGMLGSIAPSIAQASGAGKRDEVTMWFRHGLVLSVFVALPGVVVFLLAEPLLVAFGQDPAAAALAGKYLRVASIGFVPAMALAATRGLLEGTGNTRPIVWVLLVGLLFNIFGNLAFMFGRWGFPELGLVGTGVATTLANVFMLVAATVYVLVRYRRVRPYHGVHRPQRAPLSTLARIGWPIGVNLGFETALFSLSALLIGLFGTQALAGHLIAIQAASITFMIPLGLAIAASVRVGQAAGRGDRAAVRVAGVTGIWTAALVMSSTAALFTFAPNVIVSAFLGDLSSVDPVVVGYAVTFLGYAAAFQVADGVQVAANASLRGLKDTRIPMLVSLVSYWGFGITTSWFLGVRMGMEGRGVWIGLVVGLTVAAFALVTRFLLLSRRASPGLPPDTPPNATTNAAPVG